MQTVIVQVNNQITLPPAIMHQANLHPQDKLVIAYENGQILLKVNASQEQQPILPDIMGLFGCAKGTYGSTTAEIDAYIENERRSWKSQCQILLLLNKVCNGYTIKKSILMPIRLFIFLREI